MVSGALEDLRQRWAEEAVEREQLDAVIELEDLDLDDDDAEHDEAPADPDAALQALRAEPDDDQPWRRP